MKPAEQVLQFIEAYTRGALERPHMYASSPAALEDVLRTLDALRQFITHDAATFNWDTPYHRFLKRKGFGASTFTGRQRVPSVLTEQDKEGFRALADFWSEYLAGRSAQ